MQLPPQQSRRARGPQSVADCGGLGGLFTKAAALETLDQQLRQRLLPTLAEQVRLGGVHGERIVFVASSAAWASRLRMEQAAILRLARILGLSARVLIVKVAPLPARPPEPAKRLVLSRAAAHHLRAAASSLADPELRARFLALAALAES
ncbi:DciA family protein [Metallibacterium scheffleri]|uniref:DciA family protein n=1 Tax=Metallibacterium scheffleri TaxID=993689 RepID=UPI0009BF13B0|nr:DciA family protein [Metallibacterium scheffleri]